MGLITGKDSEDNVDPDVMAKLTKWLTDEETDEEKGFLALTEKKAMAEIVDARLKREHRVRRKLTKTEELLLGLFCIGWALLTIGLVLL